MKYKVLKKALLTALTASATSVLSAQYSPIGFEGGTIHNIPWGTNVGVPAGVDEGASFSYAFTDGNNIQSFRNGGAGTVNDSDDIRSNTSIQPLVPDYYKSSSFGWQMVGFKPTNNIIADWTTFDSTFIGSGNFRGVDYPGSGSDIGETFNINKNFSPAYTNLAAAPGLGDYFLDVYGGSSTITSQIKLDFRTGANALYDITLAFGGRDIDSENQRGYFRLLQGNTVVFSGDTNDSPFQAYERTGTGPNYVAALDGAPSRFGVKQNGWEYFKSSFNVEANTIYTLELLLPDQLNFDFALGSEYTNVPNIEIVPVPEPGTYGALAAAGLIGLAALRRRAKRHQ